MKKIFLPLMLLVFTSSLWAQVLTKAPGKNSAPPAISKKGSGREELTAIKKLKDSYLYSADSKIRPDKKSAFTDKSGLKKIGSAKPVNQAKNLQAVIWSNDF